MMDDEGRFIRDEIRDFNKIFGIILANLSLGNLEI